MYQMYITYKDRISHAKKQEFSVRKETISCLLHETCKTHEHTGNVEWNFDKWRHLQA